MDTVTTLHSGNGQKMYNSLDLWPFAVTTAHYDDLWVSLLVWVYACMCAGDVEVMGYDLASIVYPWTVILQNLNAPSPRITQTLSCSLCNISWALRHKQHWVTSLSSPLHLNAPLCIRLNPSFHLFSSLLIPLIPIWLHISPLFF